MDFLLEEGFSKELIQKMLEKYDESAIDIFKIEQENVEEVIHFFKKIGINQIDLLLLSHIEIFTKDVSEIKEAFAKQNIPTIVEEINKNITIIDYI